ncbi:glycosyltransferase family 2 protein [Paenibacillus humicola]|uniref:glycosyltransferase family 2 protein n=1 Tax=Paenibacillus humicola TaxID=3110540 RepID=UPI00237B9213|nr:glycosyltransferase family 2 protein [Paenibacillus humicola]
MAGRQPPLVSVITPSFNQAAFIQETIQSVLTQDYPHLEHLVIDGGSTDGTLELLQQYAASDGRFRFISEPDRGQSHALNKGFGMAKGSLIGWLNSDDTYLPGAVSKAVSALQKHPEWAMVYGRAYYIDEHSEVINFYPVESFDPKRLYHINTICQPAAFFRKPVIEKLGGIDEQLYFCMDYDLWIRIAKQYPVGDIEDPLANARLHADSKNVKDWLDRGIYEAFQTSLKYYGSVSDYWLMEFIGSHWNKGIPWLMQKIKESAISGSSPYVVYSNQYEDGWAPPRFRFVVRSETSAPLHTVIVRGTHLMPAYVGQDEPLHLSVLLNGKLLLERYTAGPGEFSLEIPAGCGKAECEIQLVSETSYVPLEYGLNDDSRPLSFMVGDIIPLSAREYDVYAMFRPLH